MSLLEQITTRRAELADQARHLAKQLAEVEHELDRVSVAEQVVTQLLSEGDDRLKDRLDDRLDDRPPMRPPDQAEQHGAVQPASITRFIPERGEAQGPHELPADYRLLLQVVTAAEGPIACKDACQAAGLPLGSAQVEGARAKLKRLVTRGWLRKTPTGAFLPMS